MTVTTLQLLTFILALFVFMMTPGPGVFATIAKAMTEGAWAVLPLAIGLAAGDAIYMVFSALGLSALATNYATLFTVIKFAGAGYLFYLAWKMWITLPDEICIDKPAQATRSDAIKSLTSGFLISGSNPKVILFYVSLLPSFFPVATLNSVDITLLCGVIFISATISMMIYAFIAHFAQKRLKSPVTRQIFNRSGSSLMLLAGIWLILKR